MNVTGGSTDVTVYVALTLLADGTDATGLTIADLDLQYVRTGSTPSAKVDATALAATNTAHTDNYAIEVDATDQPGLYRVDFPDAAFAAGAKEVILSVKHTLCKTAHRTVLIDAPVNVTKVDGVTAETDFESDVLADTTVASVTSPTVFRLTAGPPDDDACNGSMAVFIDQSNNVQRGRCLITDYDGSDLEVTLAAAAPFTVVAGDLVKIVATPASLPGALDSAVGGIRDVARINGVAVTAVTNVLSHLGTTGASTAQTGDAYAIVNSGTFGNSALKTLIDTVDDLLDTEVAALTTELAKVPKSDGTASWNATALAAIQSEANDALVANHLDHLIGVADPGGVVANNSFLAKLVSKSATATFSDYVNTTDSLQAIRDNFPANFNGLVIDGSGVVSADVQEILGYSLGSGVVGDTSFIGANFEDFFFNNESSTSAKVGDISSILTDTAEIGAAGAGLTEAGGTGDHLTALATQASVNTIDDLLDTEVGALQTTLNALFTTALSESYRSAGAAPTMAQFAFETLAHLGDCSITSTTKTLNNLAGTAAKTFTLNSSSAPTSITEAT